MARRVYRVKCIANSMTDFPVEFEYDVVAYNINQAEDYAIKSGADYVISVLVPPPYVKTIIVPAHDRPNKPRPEK